MPPKNWKEKWLPVSDLAGGGQGDTKIVRESARSVGTPRFLKVLRQQNDVKRRKRMYREVAAYRTIKHPRIPRLIDTNADLFEDQTYKLYLVTEYVPGRTLGEFISARGPLDFAGALAMSELLLEAVEYCHSNDVVHRDIKPDNIILSDDSLADPVLVDFGLSFNNAEGDPLQTEIAVELGNRFLRLPELSDNTAMKRDPRSDITFCAAVLLYSITGLIPRNLIDHRSQRPHQHPETLARLAEVVHGHQMRHLLYFFDKAFELNPINRWQSASEMKGELSRIAALGLKMPAEYTATWAEIEAYRNSASVQATQLREKLLREALQEFSRAFLDIRNRVNLSWMEVGVAIDPKAGIATTEAALMPIGEQIRGRVGVKISIVGGEVVFDIAYRGQTDRLFRTPVASPKYGTALVTALEPTFLRQLMDDISH
ncbi:MAG TPA: protein kinase [Bryobacteraceae bacterium]|nr:protein kinase [Bryobacteraceae bacterium]